MKKNKYKIIAGIVILIILAVTFWWGGDAPGLSGTDSNKPDVTVSPTASPTVSPAVSPIISPTEVSELTENKSAVTQAPVAETAPPVKTAEVSVSTTIVPTMTVENSVKEEIAPKPSALPTPTAEVKKDEKLRCTISVRCDKIIENIKYLPEEKRGLIPSDGVILKTTEAVFNDGENVFNVLQRELKRAKIHLEFVNTPIYNSVYIEGINNIYEFDCGENSGWMYSVNGEFPRYGSSGYKLKDGDKIEWVYTCDLGRDVGGYYAGSE